MLSFYNHTEPANNLSQSNNIAFLMRNYLPISLLAGAFLSLAWTSNLIRPTLIIEIDTTPRPNLLHYLITLTFFTFLFTSIAVIRALTYTELKKRFDCKFLASCAMIGEALGIFLGINILSSSRVSCGNTTCIEILFFQLIIMLFWGSVGFLMGGLSAIFSKKF